MIERSWAQQATDRFFDNARRISGGSTIQAVAVPGSLSYTVIYTGRPGKRQDLIVSFREPESTLDQGVIKLAKLSKAPWCRKPLIMEKCAVPAQLSPSMPYFQCISCLEAFNAKTELNTEEEARQVNDTDIMLILSRFFARCWTRPQPVDDEVQKDAQEGALHRLIKRSITSSSMLSGPAISELERSLPNLFKQTCPQILTYNDLS
ncbi:hypothetical protein BDV23DRAFT_180965 [Aspergillus alliaceus]|uniref:Uncharacterized protein n=1 Tax=Petromyces alliaceus TaxID=209559 RepID=A0A5N7CG82_PETAA|nr:hypothetical protein BDV23DRAFT_180965 [Aspergillus alliaceus]